MLSAANNHLTLSVIMLNVVAPFCEFKNIIKQVYYWAAKLVEQSTNEQKFKGSNPVAVDNGC